MNSPLPPDPYNALGVPKDATSNQIRLAHRKLVLTCHPDKVTDEKAKAIKTEQFQQVQQAYEILSDESRRKRYDEKVKLAELRAELMSEKKLYTGHSFASTRPQEYSARPTATASYETRENVIYETREPKQEKAPRYHSPSEDYPSAHYDHFHSVPRKSSDRNEYRSSRRQSGPAPEDTKRSKGRDHDEYEDAGILRERENDRKMREHVAHAERRKKRDKDRKQDYQVKYSARVASDSESEYETKREAKIYEPEPKRKYESTKYKVKNSRYDSESDHDLEAKTMYSAMSHIQKKETRPTIYRYVTKEGRPPQPASVPPPPPPPPPPPAPSQRYRDEVDTPRRSSARSRSSRDESRPKISREDRRPSVIDVSEPRRPSLPTHTSEPAHIRIPPSADKHGFPRSATMETRSRSTKVPGVVRATTSPLTSMLSPRYNSDSDRVRSTKSTKADIYESPGSSSRSPSPEYRPEYQKPIKYRVSHNSGDDRGSARVVSLEPDRPSRSTRESSPHAKRPSVSTRASSSARVAPSRSNSYVPDHAVPVRPYTGRSETFHESHRSPLTPSSRSKPLFGEVSYSPRISTKDAIYSSLPKSASTSYYDRHDDDHHHRYESRSRPSVSRGEPYRRGETVH